MSEIALFPEQVAPADFVAGEIRAAMARRNMSGRKLALRLGVSQPWVSRRLSGETPPDANDLSAIAKVLDVHPGSFFPGWNGDGPAAGLRLSDAEERFVLALRASLEGTKKPQSVEGLGLSLPDLDSNQEPIG